MRVAYLIEHEPARRRGLVSPVIVAISDWDGVHRGHAALAQRCAALALAQGAHAVALLPWPSPEGGDNTPTARLTTLEERIAQLDALGCFEALYIAPGPTEPLADDAALAWLRGLGDVQALLGEPRQTEAVARLWPAGLAAVAQAAGVVVEQGPWAAETCDALDQSATIRELVSAGHMREATAALGYTYTVTGEVVGGDRRGRLLGFPTANLRPEPSKLTPGNGIYAAWARLPGEGPRWPAVVSIGVRPTFGQDARRQVEAYLLDATIDLYGIQLRLEFVDYLRAELRFESVEALIAQMQADCEHARQTLRAAVAQGASATGERAP
jgi:riboflavin kinase/FMN adenylyltransferase